ncbi:hypothetical protein FRUB_01946 [Fimbriiglobus ruber]|uniref:Uncharacterized protein n=2 Tax=Fimbriiglobus ruber TaxID=1908690 RepID=A0A225EAN1_9BACT|nr:hypothetical protein FRUB_01946 [Fimbriiglobus ruber]
MRLAAFRLGKTLRQVEQTDLPIESDTFYGPFLAELREFKRQILPTDTLYYFDADQSEWDKGFGSEGFALVRDGELFRTLTIRMN